MTDRLDDLIREIQETSELSAECRNALHGCLSYHPWGKGKGFDQRKKEALFVTSSRLSVDGNLLHKIERLTQA